MKFEWELIAKDTGVYSYEYTRRAKVKGGWLVKFDSCDGVAMQFIPDEYHSWKIDVSE